MAPSVPLQFRSQARCIIGLEKGNVSDVVAPPPASGRKRRDGVVVGGRKRRDCGDWSKSRAACRTGFGPVPLSRRGGICGQVRSRFRNLGNSEIRNLGSQPCPLEKLGRVQRSGTEVQALVPSPAPRQRPVPVVPLLTAGGVAGVVGLWENCCIFVADSMK